MRFVERVGDLNRHLQRLVERQCALRQSLRQRLPFQMLHHQEVDPVLAADVVDGADVRMTQRGERLGFALEPLLQVWIRRDMLGQDFDGDRAVQAGVAGFVHLTHAAFAECGDDLIRTKPNAGGERHDPPGERNREPAEL